MSGRNPYHVLGLKKGATEAEIKEAYKVLAKKYHPDRNHGDKDALARFIEIKEAYEQLLERKSSKTISVVEESAIGVVRTAKQKQIPRRALWALAAASVGLALAGIIRMFLLPNVDLVRGRAMINAGDLDGATKVLARRLREGGEDAREVRLELAAARIGNAQLPQAEALLSGADDPVAIAIRGDVQVETHPQETGTAVASWREAWQKAKGNAPADRAAETAARVYAGYLRIGATDDAARLATEAQKLFPDQPWTQWIATVSKIRDGLAGQILASASNEPADEFGKVLRGTLHVAAVRSAVGPSGKATMEELDDLRSSLPDLAELGRTLVGEKKTLPFGYLYPSLTAARPKPDDWRATTSVEYPAPAVFLSLAAGCRNLEPSERAAKCGSFADVFERYADEVSRTHPVYAPFLLDVQGQQELAEGGAGLDAAGRTFEAVLRRPGKAPDPVALAGLAAVARAKSGSPGVSDAELKAWEHAVQADPRNPEFHWALAQALAMRGRSAQAIASDRRAVELDPDFSLAWLDLGDAWRQSGNAGEALHAYESASRFRDTSFLAQSSIGDLLYDRRQYPAAAAAYRKAALASHTRTGPRLAEDWFRIACTESMAHEEKKTREALKYAIDAGLHETLRIRREPALGWFRSRVDVTGLLREAEAHKEADALQQRLAPKGTPPLIGGGR